MATSHRRSTLKEGTMPYRATLARIRGEYLEMPGLRLTVAQAQRLCGIERELCEAVLSALVDARFLCTKPDGAYARSTDGALPHPRPAKADLPLAKRAGAAS